MKTDVRMALYRKLRALKPNESWTVRIESAPVKEVISEARGWARGHLVNLEVDKLETGSVKFTVLPGPFRDQRMIYGFDEIKNGESKEIDYLEAGGLVRLRVAASSFKQRTGVHISVSKLSDTKALLSRADGSRPAKKASEVAYASPTVRDYKFPFHGLRNVGDSFFLHISEHQNTGALRSSAYYHGNRLGMVFSVSYHPMQNDAPEKCGHTVTRVR